MMELLLMLTIFSSVDAVVYLYNTLDSSSVEFYDCINHDGLFYCRRPEQPIALHRNLTQCHHNGTTYSLRELRSRNVTISTILYEWKSSIENVEQYSRFLSYSGEPNGYVCHCTDPRSFGKNCEYLLPRESGTFYQTLQSEKELQRYHPQNGQIHGDIICYRAFECNSGLLCLDWREICDGVQQCMSGLDEDNCDALEMNECEVDEYRCMNGMCIPEEYFLDGEFDCLDWSDEIQFYDDTQCPIEGASIQCDDRICLPNQWSCGDGQCISDRFDFQKATQIQSQCRNRREQYYMCETNYIQSVWTLPHGKCAERMGYEEENITLRTREEQCQYLLRCLLSRGAEKHCPCTSYPSCQEALTRICASRYIQYPSKGLMAPYILFFYDRARNTSSVRPDFAWINGTIKCLGNLTTLMGYRFPNITSLRQIEDTLCLWGKNESSLVNQQACSRSLIAFSNLSSTSICSKSKKCISSYRLKDGFSNCADRTDETRNISMLNICSNMSHQRFRCSIHEPTCLGVAALGNLRTDCNNTFDEFWMGSRTKLVNINCNKQWKYECDLLRQYIKKSWLSDRIEHVVVEQGRIPFRSYCDTFWDLALQDDENMRECRRWWRCPEEQWQCDSGQCIDIKWILDDVWDCFDGSDENHRLMTERIFQIDLLAGLRNKSNYRNRTTPFANLCNLTIEFPCLAVNISDSLGDLLTHRPCVNRDRIGDGHIDCYGAIDESNTVEQCEQATMLGHHFKCRSSAQCIPYWNHCIGDRCLTKSDDQVWCQLRESADVCNNTSGDIMCINGTCVRNGRCNRIRDCSFGEDEYMCEYQPIIKLTSVPYRKDKETKSRTLVQVLPLIRYPTDSNVTEASIVATNPTSTVTTPSTVISDPVAYWCNRGVGVRLFNDSIICFCPPQYYGEKCQYHTHRILVSFYLNLSQSIYSVHSDIQIVLKLVVLFLYQDDIISNHIFHVRPSMEMFVYSKKTIHLLYPHSWRFLEENKSRDESLLFSHQHSVRIETYERMNTGEPSLIAVWQYPIYFDDLPVFRLSKVLRLVKPSMIKDNPCSHHPCHKHEDCQPLLNDPSRYVCLCQSNYTGENCSMEDPICANDYCAPQSLCKPKYRGLSVGNDLPYCICSFNRFGDRCDVEHHRCSMTPCHHNGSCFSTSKPDTVACHCLDDYSGKFCESKKPEVKLSMNNSQRHDGAVVQYLKIDYISLNLILVHQRVFRKLPSMIEYRHGETIAPEIVLAKLYSSDRAESIQFYLLAVHIHVTSVRGLTQLNESNRCVDVRLLIFENETQLNFDISPIQYHSLCQNRRALLCFRDDYYLCICSNDHSRVECFRYDMTLDHCSRCLAGGRCLRGDRSQSNDFICLCPRCYSGIYCQFNSNSFAFTLDQLFFTDLSSVNEKLAVSLLITVPLLLFVLALPNNYFTFLTFHRSNCLSHGVAHYLRDMSVVNQLNLALLAARLIHLTLNITSVQPYAEFDLYLCKILSYLLTSSSRMVNWLSSLVAIERMYMTLFLNGRWLRKPQIARRLIIFTLMSILISGSHELFFVESLFGINKGHGGMCVLQFPIIYHTQWQLYHLILSIFHSIMPLLVNICSTVIISCVVIRKKIKTRMYSIKHWIEIDEHVGLIFQKVGQYQISNKLNDEKVSKSHVAMMNIDLLLPLGLYVHPLTLFTWRAYLHQTFLVLSEHKELVVGPGITLIPQLFSLPLFIISFTLYCENLENSWSRYPLIALYLTSFIPQLISFILYVLPSSFYLNEWHHTRIAQWISQWHRSVPRASTTLGTTY